MIIFSYYTKYDVSKYYSSRGIFPTQYNFEYIKEFSTLNFQGENLMAKIKQLNNKYLGKNNSIDMYMHNIGAELGYFPIIYRRDKEEYAIFHLVAHNSTTITEEDTHVNFSIIPEFIITKKIDLITTIDKFIEDNIYYFININRGIIEIVDNENIIIKFDKKLKNKIKPHMIYKTQRMYQYNSDTDDLDSLINTKIDDILDYEFYVDQDTSSKFYKDYYTNTEYGNSFEVSYTKKELNDLLNGTHRIFKMGELGGTFGTGGYIGIDIQVIDVFDSTATATYFKHPNISFKLRRGDIFLY